MVSAHSQENCGSSDKRSMVEQLDCFCGTDSKSIIQQKVDKLGALGKEFGERRVNDCNSAINSTLALSTDSKITSDMSKKLKSLNYSDEQINKILTPVTKRMEAVKLIREGSCSKGKVTVRVWPFSYKSSEPAGCEALNKMDPSELESVMLLAISMNVLAVKPTTFTNQFKELEEASKLVEAYPEERILKCLKLAGNMNGTAECSKSKADDSKIDNCVTLRLGSTNSLKCLQSNADASGIKSCKYLGLGETNTLNCLQVNPEGQLARTCKFLQFGETNTMKCLEMKPDIAVAEMCKFLAFGETNAINCLKIKPSEQVVRACKILNFTEAGTIKCLNIKPELDSASVCKSLNFTEAGAIKCLNIKPELDIASACKNLNFTEAGLISCLQSKASPEKMQQCGFKNLTEAQTLSCLSQPLSEKPANSQVSDIPRAPKEWTDETNENSGSALKLNNTSK